MESLLNSFNIPLAAAALQYSLREKMITSTIVGMSTPDRVEETERLSRIQIPEDIWNELNQLAEFGRHGMEN
jgi:D-threo-aldose 1-dehydrogenase